MNRLGLAVMFVVVGSCLVVPASASDESGSGLVGADLEALTASIDRLAAALQTSLEEQKHQQDLLIAIQYLQFRTRNIEGLESEMRQIEGHKVGAEERVARMEQEVQTLERRLKAEGSEDSDNLAGAIDRYNRRIESEGDRIDRYERQILDLENRILQSRRQLVDLETFISENLDLGP